jgi:hypothetical protein
VGNWSSQHLAQGLIPCSPFIWANLGFLKAWSLHQAKVPYFGVLFSDPPIQHSLTHDGISGKTYVGRVCEIGDTIVAILENMRLAMVRKSANNCEVFFLPTKIVSL